MRRSVALTSCDVPSSPVTCTCTVPDADLVWGVGLGFWVLGFGLWVLDSGFWISGFGFWVLG